MNVLLTGGAGYIGSHVAAELLALNYNVIIVDNFSNSSPDICVRLRKITGKNVTVITLDLNDKQGLRHVLKYYTIDAVIHLAGFKAVGESVMYPLRYYRNNLLCSINLLEAMAEYGISNIIFSSSATVYGTPKHLPLTEETETCTCINPYGNTKQMIERIIIDSVAADNAFSAIILRYFNPVGAHSSGLIGERPNGIPTNLMPYITQVASGLLPKLSVFGGDYPTKDGTGVRDYIHVVDLAKGHVCALHYCLTRSGADIINLGTGKGSSVIDLINTFERVNNIKVPYVISNRRAGDIGECYADASKAKEKMGWSARLTLDDMCKDAWNWQKNISLL